ncbi:Glutamine-dependent NAD(+) synthetase [Candidatus Venteria ishoeyi]|uniref:NH(3)-dependent NAD(+) synthetase n=1 Tax=Candidatus Venteria ishoeyi TaxID=1899563 RepID=A0A1H6FFH8_9GAMM|nr:Glutamine-dependent NAD(+) synthetase [Candidatus Venteria ishoeyi]
MLEQDIKPRDIMTRAAFENAMVLLMALGGSTNAVLHLIAMARSVDVELSIDDFQAISDRIPFIADLKPSGRYVMEDLHNVGLYDYSAKSRSQGFALSLSGGADSAAVACLIRLMVELGVAEVGIENFCARLNLPQTELNTIEQLMPVLLVCVYQATRNSSETTRNAAEKMAHAVGAEYLELDIENMVSGYRQHIEQAIGRSLNWTQDDLALQNIQARARAPGVWMLANLRNALLLATSNRSEAAVGYATMDGDTSGGLSPLAGIDKHFIRHWLRWLEQNAPNSPGVNPIPALSYINTQQPTAELRPGAEQTDEADLMPYVLLNAIEKAAIRDRQTPWEIYCLLNSRFDYTAEQLLTWIERFFQLWIRNQWKRERYAPSFHLDDESLDPKTWCRFPILSGGFSHELKEMRKNALSQMGEEPG